MKKSKGIPAPDYIRDTEPKKIKVRWYPMDGVTSHEIAVVLPLIIQIISEPILFDYEVAVFNKLKPKYKRHFEFISLPGKEDYTEVKTSPLHGNGLFAKIDILKDTVIGEIKVKKISRWPRKKCHHAILVGKEMFEVICILKYTNNSNIPNVCYWDDNTLTALEDIKAGDELTHKYC